MKKFLSLTICLLFMCFVSVNAEMIKAGVSLNEIPKDFFGSWRINGFLDNTNAYETFKPQSADYWNLSRVEDYLMLENPLSGVKAQVSVDSVEGNLVTFTKVVRYDNKVLTDVVQIRLDKNSFTGFNHLKLESFSLIDNHLMKTETATYKISGEKISGN